MDDIWFISRAKIGNIDWYWCIFVSNVHITRISTFQPFCCNLRIRLRDFATSIRAGLFLTVPVVCCVLFFFTGDIVFVYSMLSLFVVFCCICLLFLFVVYFSLKGDCRMLRGWCRRSICGWCSALDHPKYKYTAIENPQYRYTSKHITKTIEKRVYRAEFNWWHRLKD